jgi:putative transposase
MAAKLRLSNKVNAIKKIYLKAEQPDVAAVVEKRKNRKAAAERYEPIKGHFPGADYPLAVAQIDHTPNGCHRCR